MSRANFPLNLDNTRNMQAFFIGLEDARVREGLKSQEGVPADVLQRVERGDDEHFRAMASDVVERLRGVARSSVARADSPVKLSAPHVTANLNKPENLAVVEKGREIRAYIENKYPDALALLNDYATASLGQTIRSEGSVEVNADAVANAEVLVNAAVYTNVAAATMVVVAAAAVVVVAAVV